MDMGKLNPTVLAINAGSSSLKASLFRANGPRQDFRYHVQASADDHHLKLAYNQLFKDIEHASVDIIAHRFVHGGDIPEDYRHLDNEELLRLKNITPLAPLHLPANLLGAEICATHFDSPQIACFDTAFHHQLPDIAKRLPIPSAENIHRYGFHGISYAYLVSQLPSMIPHRANQKVILAHLGSGSSLCLTIDCKSVDTTMGYTPCGGIPMATRSGDLDPGVMIELSKRYDSVSLSDMVNHKMGLISLSNGESSDMSELIVSKTEIAQFAVDYFCYQITGAIGSLAAKAGGIDGLVFSGGIGEHSPIIRAKICESLNFLNLKIEHHLNLENAQLISMAESLPICRIATDEELMMFNYAKEYMHVIS
ncbi:acetate/propionate family kinase [Methylophilus flavus]|uniref:Acetate kinase n=1 Tax=Methylophilus flavus TaxID=640084 RepID=A0ABW3PEM8_9PROT